MRRYLAFLGPGMALALGGCLPSDYFNNLLGSSVSAVVSVLLSDALNVLIPPL